MVCVYEGKEEETFHGRRRVLTNRHCFCGVNRGEAYLKFWDVIYQYLGEKLRPGAGEKDLFERRWRKLEQNWRKLLLFPFVKNICGKL